MAELATIDNRKLPSHRHSDLYGSTPPDNAVSLPLTPPATDERQRSVSDAPAVVEAVRSFRACRDRTATEFHTSSAGLQVTPEQYCQLQRSLECDPSLRNYVNDKVRYDYDPDSETLTIRMPSPVHDFFRSFIANEIRDQLKRVVDEGGTAGEFAAKIEDGGSSRILLREGISDGTSVDLPVRREPDGQFQHQDAAYPGLVLEVSLSQDGKNLKKLALDYILRSNGDIKAVIGFDVNYGRASTVSLWRPNYTREDGEELEVLEARQEIACVPFRSRDGSPANEKGELRLKLSDFATDKLPSGDESVSLSISFEQLTEFLARAEQMHQAREDESGRRGVKCNRPMKKRKASSSPADELRFEDEAKFQAGERNAADRAAAEDKEFQPTAAKRRF